MSNYIKAQVSLATITLSFPLSFEGEGVDKKSLWGAGKRGEVVKITGWGE
jgi:hypothetical protein